MHRSERAEQTDSQGQLPPHEHTGELKQSTRCYSVFVFGCFWSLTSSENQNWEPSMHSIYQSLWHFPVYMNAVWVSQRWRCVQQVEYLWHKISKGGVSNVYDPGIHTEDQGLPSAKERERSSYVLGICWVL